MTPVQESPAGRSDHAPERGAIETSGLGPRRVVRVAVGVVAAILCLVAIPMPLWSARLEAPQYKGDNALHLTAYGDRLVGDVCEINGLNHYIGMRPLGEPSVPCGSAELGHGENTVGRIAPEMALWLPSAVLAAVAALVASITRGRWMRRLGAAVLWVLPVGVLVMTQYHLYDYGHDLDPSAAFHPDVFTPYALGPSKIYQFDVLALPGSALGLVALAAAIVSFGPTLLARYVPAARS